MAADVSSMVRILNGYKEDQINGGGGEVNGKAKVLITRDLLGGCSKIGAKELDLDSQVPNGWEKRLDMKSGQIYLQPCSTPISSDQKKQQNQNHPHLQDLNFPPSSSSNLPEETLDLKLVPSMEYQSVCTLEKVKSALERAERDSAKKRSHFSELSSSSPLNISSSPSSSSIRASTEEGEEEEEKPSKSSGLLFASACPSCLLYVLISKRNPKCPRCDSHVPCPAFKKPRIDLNLSV
ncbi:uncharacterized protein LOC143884666 [Tasmannia lanceolata]|uniref:uncharacterized protein LOC143884666 n=1 Tax=Tasmannia lanceolata TaxID=3420 RepID=UPI00406496EA